MSQPPQIKTNYHDGDQVYTFMTSFRHKRGDAVRIDSYVFGILEDPVIETVIVDDNITITQNVKLV